MLESILSILASVIPAVLGWFGMGKAPDGPSPDFTSGRALGAAEQNNGQSDKVLSDVEKARAAEWAIDADRLRNTANPLGPNKYRRD